MRKLDFVAVTQFRHKFLNFLLTVSFDEILQNSVNISHTRYIIFFSEYVPQYPLITSYFQNSKMEIMKTLKLKTTYLLIQKIINLGMQST